MSLETAGLPFIERRAIMNSVLKFSSPRIRIAQYFEPSAEEMVRAARQQGLKGVVAKKKDGRYEAGKRSGSWAKYRLNRGQELVIGGYVPGSHGLDSIIVGYYIQRTRPDLCNPSEEWICASDATTDIREAKAPDGAELSVCKSS